MTVSSFNVAYMRVTDTTSSCESQGVAQQR